MTHKHTPGPWVPRAIEAEGVPYYAVCAGKKGRTVIIDITVDAPDRGDFNTKAYEAEIKANAYLVAAAPDLLDACHLALGSLEAAVFQNATVNLVRQAIAKAEGR